MSQQHTNTHTQTTTRHHHTQNHAPCVGDDLVRRPDARATAQRAAAALLALLPLVAVAGE